MNYISEINAFYDWLIENPMSGNAQALWHRLMAYCNAFGWKEQFTITNGRLVEDLNISRIELDRLRNLLVQKGRIVYQKGIGNQCGTYMMLSFVYQDNANPVTQSDTQVLHKPYTNDIQSDTQTVPLDKLNKTKLNNDIPPLSPTGEKPDEKTPESENKNPKDELNQIFKAGCAGFTESLKQAVKDWIAYKAEKQDKYKPTGLKNLLAEIANSVKTYGEPAVIEVITQSMAANYKGIVFDKLKNNYNSQTARNSPEPEENIFMRIIREEQEKERREQEEREGLS